MESSAPAGKAEASRRRILDAAARLFRERGYSAVSLRDLAAGAGLQAGSVYYHFESKEQIVLAVLDAGIAAVHATVAETVGGLPADTPAAELIRAAMLSHLRALFEHSDYTSANVRIYHHVPAEIRRTNARARRRYEQLWAGILERAEAQAALRPDIDREHLRRLVISSLNATLDWFDGRGERLVELADSYADILLAGALVKAA